MSLSICPRVWLDLVIIMQSSEANRSLPQYVDPDNSTLASRNLTEERLQIEIL